MGDHKKCTLRVKARPSGNSTVNNFFSARTRTLSPSHSAGQKFSFPSFLCAMYIIKGSVIRMHSPNCWQNGPTTGKPCLLPARVVQIYATKCQVHVTPLLGNSILHSMPTSYSPLMPKPYRNADHVTQKQTSRNSSPHRQSPFKNYLIYLWCIHPHASD